MHQPQCSGSEAADPYVPHHAFSPIINTRVYTENYVHVALGLEVFRQGQSRGCTLIGKYLRNKQNLVDRLVLYYYYKPWRIQCIQCIQCCLQRNNMHLSASLLLLVPFWVGTVDFGQDLTLWLPCTSYYFPPPSHSPSINPHSSISHDSFRWLCIYLPLIELKCRAHPSTKGLRAFATPFIFPTQDVWSYFIRHPN